MNFKTVILPILSTIAILIQVVFGIQIPEEVLNELAVSIGNLILAGSIIYGIIKNYKKEGK